MISILNEKFPNYIYFQRYRNEFLYLDKTPEKKQRLINSDSVVFHAFNENNFNIFKDKLSELTNKDITYKEVFANKNGERLYMVYLKPKNWENPLQKQTALVISVQVNTFIESFHKWIFLPDNSVLFLYKLKVCEFY